MAESKKNLFQKLQEIQTQIKVYKDQRVEYGKTKYSFRSLEQILAELKPLLEINGIYISQSDEIELIGNNYFVKAITKAYDIETGEFVVNTAYAQIDYSTAMNDSQKTGSASSYARKYGLCGLLGIEGEADADQHDQEKGQAQKANGRQNKNESTITQKEIDAINAMLKSNDDIAIANQVLAEAGYKNPKDIKKSDYVRIGSEIKRRLAAK